MLDVRPPQTRAERDAMHRLRYQVYCHEKHYLDAADYPDGREADELDGYATPFVLVDTARPREVLGCFRLIPDNPHGPPMLREMEVTAPLPPASDAMEMSRLIVAREHRASPEPIFLMMREVGRYSLEHGLDYVFAIMERPLAVLLARLGFRMERVGRTRPDMTAPFIFSMRRYWEELPAANPRMVAMLRAAGIPECCQAVA